MRKGKKGDQSSKIKTNNQVNGDNSPIMFRRALQCKTNIFFIISNINRYIVYYIRLQLKDKKIF